MEIKNDEQASSFMDGYTGDTYCTSCGKLIEKGRNIPRAGIFIPLSALSFKTNGGAPIKYFTRVTGARVDLSRYVTEKEGYVFGGWYLDKELTRPVQSVVLLTNTVVYAKWIEAAGPEEP